MFVAIVLIVLLVLVLLMYVVGGPRKCWVDKRSPLNLLLFREPMQKYDAQLVNVWVDKPWRTDGGRIPCHLEKVDDHQHSRYLIIYSHGNNEDILHCLHFTRELCRIMGSDVLCYDYSGYGLNPGDPFERSAVGVNTTLHTVYNHMCETYDSENILLWGYSLGSGPSVALAAELAQAGPVPLRGLVLFGAYASILKVVEDSTNRTVAGLFTERWDNLKKIKRVQCPVLILHGENDHLIPVHHAKELHRALPTSHLMIMPHTGHTTFSLPDSVTVVKKWLQEA